MILYNNLYFWSNFPKGSKKWWDINFASSAFGLKWPSLTSVDGPRGEWKGPGSPGASHSRAAGWGGAGPMGTMPPPCPLRLPPARCLSKQGKKELSIMNWCHICKVRIKWAGDHSQCPRSRLGNCLLRLAPPPFLETKPSQQLWGEKQNPCK